MSSRWLAARRGLARSFIFASSLAIVAAACARTPGNPRRPALCALDPEPARVVRYLSSAGGETRRPVFGLVLEDEAGVPTRALPLAAWAAGRSASERAAAETLSAATFDLARAAWREWRAARDAGAEPPALAPQAEWLRADDVCSAVPLHQREIDTGEKIVVGAAFNYREHALEGGGGELFLFPKPIPPTGPYHAVRPDPEVPLLDYEVEIAFVVLEDIDLAAVPDDDALESKLAYFVANDVSDREPIIRRQPVFGTSTGYAEAKGKPGFLPVGPWLVHGSDLRPYADACSRSLRLALEVEEPDGTRGLRQLSETSLAIQSPRELLQTLGAGVRPDDPESAWSVMSVFTHTVERFFVMARILHRDGMSHAVFPKGSVVSTGTPEGVAFRAPNKASLVLRALANLRSPADQLIHELRESRRQEGYLAPGDVVVASIEGLGTQRFAVEAPAQPEGQGDAGGLPGAAPSAQRPEDLCQADPLAAVSSPWPVLNRDSAQ
jgi:2-keto-4-pentenoate hydratase/2-oxohepta-3-ene-1,7-dioic acid hydratase in catechol pathway